MKNILLLISLAFTANFALAQTDSVKIKRKEQLKNQPSAPEQVRATEPVSTAVTISPSPDNVAKNNILALKNGILLVRLRTGELAIAKLTEAGKPELAASIRQQQYIFNQRMMRAFRDHYKFSPVYFFFSSDSERVKKGDTSGIFLNADLQRDGSIVLPEKPFFIAEITDIEQERGNSRNPNYNSDISFRALVLRDSLLQQLAKPFPYYIKTNTIIPPHRRNEKEMVVLLNKKLEDFYRKHLQNKF